VRRCEAVSDCLLIANMTPALSRWWDVADRLVLLRCWVGLGVDVCYAVCDWFL
jgi:hypothetical protein